ncbi:MAG TPA: hypothetical protein VGW33_12845 [Terriglobia bacterium]|nr:hypothetical protein [Terriglobia bacterium]
MHHMKTATVRDLRYRFPEIEARLREGEEIEIRKRRKVIGHLVPVRARSRRWPNFAARTRKIFGEKALKISGAEIVSWSRGDR